MLQHSQTSSGLRELTDINKLTDEYLRLAYHGLRAKDKSFNAEIKTDFDGSIGKNKCSSPGDREGIVKSYQQCLLRSE
jgi:hypothetical protein